MIENPNTNRVALQVMCVEPDCETIYVISQKTCPSCGSKYFISVARCLQTPEQRQEWTKRIGVEQFQKEMKE